MKRSEKMLRLILAGSLTVTSFGLAAAQMDDDPFANPFEPSFGEASPFDLPGESAPPAAAPPAVDDPFASAPAAPAATNPFAAPTAPAAADPFAAPAAADPFASPAAADPFASPAAADPFGAAADPFGAAADPFGSTADPFGAPTGGGDPFAAPGGDPFASFGGAFGAPSTTAGVDIPSSLRPRQFRYMEVERFDRSRVVVRRGMSADEAELFDNRIIAFYEALIGANQLPGYPGSGGANQGAQTGAAVTPNEWAQWMLYAYQVELWQRYVESVVLAGRDPDSEAERQAASARSPRSAAAGQTGAAAGGNFGDERGGGAAITGAAGSQTAEPVSQYAFGRQPENPVTPFIRWPGDIARQQQNQQQAGQQRQTRNIFNENRSIDEQLYDFAPVPDTRNMQAQPNQPTFGGGFGGEGRFDEEFGDPAFMGAGFGGGGFQGQAGVVFSPEQMDRQTVALYRRYYSQLRDIEKSQNEFVQQYREKLAERANRRQAYADWRVAQLDTIKDYVTEWNRRYTGQVVNVSGVRYELYSPGTEPEAVSDNIRVVVTEIGLTPYDLLNPDGTVRTPIED